MDTFDDSEDIDSAFDSAIVEISTIMEYRYYNPRGKVIKSKDWWTNILPYCDDKLFKHEIRTTRVDFQIILDLIHDKPIFTKKQVDVEYQLAITLARMGESGTASPWLKIAAKFGIGKGSVNVATCRVIKAILFLSDNFIYWPNEEEREGICREIKDKLPNCVGYLDGSHVKLEEAPRDDHESYFSRKHDYAIQMQAIVDNNRKIRNIFI